MTKGVLAVQSGMVYSRYHFFDEMTESVATLLGNFGCRIESRSVEPRQTGVVIFIVGTDAHLCSELCDRPIFAGIENRQAAPPDVCAIV